MMVEPKPSFRAFDQMRAARHAAPATQDAAADAKVESEVAQARATKGGFKKAQIHRLCTVCGKDFIIKSTRHKRCSAECVLKQQRVCSINYQQRMRGHMRPYTAAHSCFARRGKLSPEHRRRARVILEGLLDEQELTSPPAPPKEKRA